MSNNEYIELSGIVKAETDLAISVDFGDKEEWIPKSQCEDWPDVGEDGIIVMKEWLAYEKELI
jgi:hypothetical protein